MASKSSRLRELAQELLDMADQMDQAQPQRRRPPPPPPSAPLPDQDAPDSDEHVEDRAQGSGKHEVAQVF